MTARSYPFDVAMLRDTKSDAFTIGVWAQILRHVANCPETVDPSVILHIAQNLDHLAEKQHIRLSGVLELIEVAETVGKGAKP